MQSLLEDKRWFLDGLAYRGALHLVLAEAKDGEPVEPDPETPDSPLKKVLTGTVPVEIHEDSEYVRVIFEKVVAWQLVQESYTTWDDYEVREGSNLQTLTRSRYLDYVNQNHGWYKDMFGPALHYRVWTYDEVIDVVAHEPPKVEDENRQ